MLALSANLPEVEFAPGEAVVHEGGASGSIWILVSGALRVRKGIIQVNTITDPGALIGEMSILQGIAHSATVEATQQSRRVEKADAVRNRRMWEGYHHPAPTRCRLTRQGLCP